MTSLEQVSVFKILYLEWQRMDRNATTTSDSEARL